MASPDDELEYLSPSFDPSSLTMPRLRNVLMSHDIAYPASAKKAQLVDIFTQRLKPKARSILAARDKVRRTSRGIMDMPSSQESTVIGENDEDGGSMQPPPTPKQRQSRRSTRPSAEPSALEPPIISRTSGGRRSSSKHARQSDTETDQDMDPERPSVRKNRKSEVTPRVKVEDSDGAAVRPPMRGGVFSNENPFQSGSSPPTLSEHRRRTTASSTDRRKGSSGRRKTEGLAPYPARQQDGYTPPSVKNFEVPVSTTKQSVIKDDPEDGLEAGEDFTPEEQMEMARDRAANGRVDRFSPRTRRRSEKSGLVPRSAKWVIFLSLLGGCATWWRQEKIAVGYCGIGRPSYALSSVQIPEWASTLQPTCEPCPQHAICYEGMETRCADDFVIQAHPLSLRGLVPLAPTCEPDSEKLRRIKTVADRAVEELRERKAQAECGTLTDDNGRTIQDEINEQDLKKEVGRKRRRDMSDAEFNDLWKGAIGEIRNREEVVSSSDGYVCVLIFFLRGPILSVALYFKKIENLTTN